MDLLQIFAIKLLPFFTVSSIILGDISDVPKSEPLLTNIFSMIDEPTSLQNIKEIGCKLCEYCHIQNNM